HDLARGIHLPRPRRPWMALFFDREIPLVLDEHEPQIGSHLQSPVVVKRSNDNSGGVSKILEGVIVSDSHLARLVHAREQGRKLSGGINIAHGYTVIGIAHDITPSHLFIRI